MAIASVRDNVKVNEGDDKRYNLYASISSQVKKFTFDQIVSYVDWVHQFSYEALGSTPAKQGFQTGHLKYDSFFSELVDITENRLVIAFGYDTLQSPPRKGKPADYAAAYDAYTGNIWWRESLEKALKHFSRRTTGGFGKNLDVNVKVFE